MPNRTELDKCVFRQNNGKQTKDEKVGYTNKAEQVDFDHKDCLARYFKDGNTGKVTYYLKYASVGPAAGHLWNPHSPDFGVASVAALRNMGKEAFEFKKASKAAFDLFLHYLKTGNESYIKQADREIM